ncbi:MAG: hypothetical protein HPY81_06705 [Firmicutes bacterium]|nr:hypothetical protein [Bacillota bacterium]
MQELIKAIELAIEEERAGKERYRQYALSATMPEIKLMFEQLAQEEAAHEKRLVEKLQALKLIYLENYPGAQDGHQNDGGKQTNRGDDQTLV